MQLLSRFPVGVRVVPFLSFLALTFCQGQFGEASRYWVYFLKTLAGAGMLWAVWPWIPEMRWRWSWAGVAAGLGVFLFWVGLDGLYPDIYSLQREYLCPGLERIGMGWLCPKSDAPHLPWNPHAQFGPGLAWFFAVMRLAGSTLVVPPLEEVFYRSFLYRYIAAPDFQSVPLGAFRWTPFIVTSLIFGFGHREWVAGILCGFVYQGVVCHTKRLGDAMVAHALTNFLLGLYVMARGAWQFW